jgi:hypothetical protein
MKRFQVVPFKVLRLVVVEVSIHHNQERISRPETICLCGVQGSLIILPIFYNLNLSFSAVQFLNKSIEYVYRCTPVCRNVVY